MAYLTDSEVEDKIDLPVSLPLTEIYPGDWLIVSSVKVSELTPVRLSIRFLQIQLMALSDGTNTSAAGQKCGAQSLTGSVRIGLYKDYLNVSQTPSGPLLEVVASGVPAQIVSRDLSLEPAIFTEPGVYSVIVVGDPEYLAKVSAVGMIRMDLNPA